MCGVGGGGGEIIVSWELEIYDFLDKSKIMIGYDERVWFGGGKIRFYWEEEFIGVFESYDMGFYLLEVYLLRRCGDYDVCRYN